MFEQNQLLALFESLPPDQQSEVIDFIQHLKQRKSQTKLPEQNEFTLRKFGAMKGLVLYMSDDFNEPLEDFAEYM